MGKKKIIAVWLAFVFVFGTCFGSVNAAENLTSQDTAPESTVSQDTASESAVESLASQDAGAKDREASESAAQNAQIDYAEISEMISENWEGDYFAKMVIEPGTNRVEKDGEREKLSGEFGISASEAKDISQSEESMEEYLDEQEGIYEVEENAEGDLEVTAPYQTKRLIVLNSEVKNTYGAKDVYENGVDGETILQYETEEKAQTACEALQDVYGEENCFPDAVVSVDSSDDSQETSGASAVAVSASEDCYSWGASYMGMDTLKQEAVSLGYTQKVLVAVIDSGINSSNQLFSGRTISSNSYSFIDRNHKNISDVYGHGTHVTGIIADCTPSNVEFLILKVSDSSGSATLLSMGYALYYAVAQSADVVNLSMGYPDEKANQIHYLDDIIDKAYERGIPVCAAAGNESDDVTHSYPACNSQVITVSAIDSDGEFASYSNRGSGVDFAAPGTYIWSADWQGTVKIMSGTSMATPHIVAAAAYIKMVKPNISVKGLYKELKLYCKDLGTSGKDKYYGWGCPVLTNFLNKGITYTKYIVILRPTLKSVSNTKQGITIKWKKAKGAAQYCIYRKKNNGGWKRIATVSSAKTSYIDKKVKQGDKCRYRVRAKNGGMYGRFSSTKKIWRLTTMKKVKLRRTSKRKVKVSWQKKTYAGKYQIQYARNSRFKKARKVSASGKKKSLTTKKLKKGTWYFRIRYLYRKGGVKSWSDWSSVTKIRVR